METKNYITVDDIWKLKDGTIVTIKDRQYEYNNVGGSRTVTDLIIGDTHVISDWFTKDEEVIW